MLGFAEHMQERIEGYYNHFPPKDANVVVSQVVVDIDNGQIMKKNILTVTKDFEAGEEIYKEEPVVAALDSDLESKRSHCSHCLRKIDSAMSLYSFEDPLHAAYCSRVCQDKAHTEYHNILFGLDPPLPNELSAVPISDELKAGRKQAQESLVATLRSSGNAGPLLVAKFIARQVSSETAKLNANVSGSTSTVFQGGSSSEYSLYDDIERLRYLELPVQDQEAKLLSKALETALPGLEQFLTDERYTTLKGKMAYNAIGVCFNNGRSDKPPSQERPENVELTRTPHGTARQIGCGLYLISSYLSHSCRPSARVLFSEGTSTLHLIANHALKKGEELTMAYVDVSQASDETVLEARLRRRKELAHGWRFACGCPRCTEEAPAGGSATEEKSRDESKVEAVVSRYEENKTGLPGDLEP